MRRTRAACLGALLPILSGISACVSSPHLAIDPVVASSCLGDHGSSSVRWMSAASERDRRESMRWCAAIGPPVIAGSRTMDELRSSRLTIVSWNTHVGGGDVRSLVEDLRAGRLTDGRPVSAFVLLLQEVFRQSPRVPSRVPQGARTARRVRGTTAEDRDVESTARALGLALFYVPSMRNGGPGDAAEDRGNAILSTLPLENYTAIELPLERQRRVVPAATVDARAPDGRILKVRVTSVHLTNMVAHHGWLLSEAGRVRQARALARTLDERPIVLGGDFNTWFGAWDGAYREIARRAQAPADRDRRPTFLFLRLDHFFYRLPEGWRFAFHRADSRYGSDHYPLVGELDFGL